MILPQLLRLVQCGTLPQLPASSKGKAVTTTNAARLGDYLTRSQSQDRMLCHKGIHINIYIYTYMGRLCIVIVICYDDGSGNEYPSTSQVRHVQLVAWQLETLQTALRSIVRPLDALYGTMPNPRTWTLESWLGSWLGVNRAVCLSR